MNFPFSHVFPKTLTEIELFAVCICVCVCVCACVCVLCTGLKVSVLF